MIQSNLVIIKTKCYTNFLSVTNLRNLEHYVLFKVDFNKTDIYYHSIFVKIKQF